MSYNKKTIMMILWLCEISVAHQNFGYFDSVEFDYDTKKAEEIYRDGQRSHKKEEFHKEQRRIYRNQELINQELRKQESTDAKQNMLTALKREEHDILQRKNQLPNFDILSKKIRLYLKDAKDEFNNPFNKETVANVLKKLPGHINNFVHNPKLILDDTSLERSFIDRNELFLAKNILEILKVDSPAMRKVVLKSILSEDYSPNGNGWN